MLKKGAMFTDLHIGRRGGGIHNQDCLDYVVWFCERVRADPTIDHILFLGDWHQIRNSILIDSLDVSFRCAKMIDQLGLPVYFVVGNHDLFYRHTRDIYSTRFVSELNNFIVVDQPRVFKELGPKGALVSPFAFHNEYEDLQQYLNVPIWFGHFEFKDFVIAGQTTKMQTGPDPTQYAGPKYIFSGHYHKRQATRNIVYIGSCFPYDFSDANDSERGMATYDYISEEVDFIDWDQCPTFHRLTLSELLDITDDGKFNSKSRIQCIVDIPVSYEEINVIRSTFLEQHNIREISFDDTSLNAKSITEDNTEDSVSLKTTEEYISDALDSIESNLIDNQLLKQIYSTL
jgi:DNA repair exonuclease SbcCD nuclease subunit